MAERGRGSRSTSGEVAHQRLKGQMEEIIGVLSDRLDDKFERLDTRLSRMENDIGDGRLDRQNLRTEIHETRRDLGELRDAMAMQKTNVAPAQVAGTKKAIKEIAKSPAGIAVQVAIGLAALVAGVESLPKAHAFVERAWAFLGAADAEPVKVPEK